MEPQETYIKVEFKHIDGTVSQVKVFNTWEYTTGEVLQVFKNSLSVAGYPVNFADEITIESPREEFKDE